MGLMKQEHALFPVPLFLSILPEQFVSGKSLLREICSTVKLLSCLELEERYSSHQPKVGLPIWDGPLLLLPLPGPASPAPCILRHHMTRPDTSREPGELRVGMDGLRAHRHQAKPQPVLSLLPPSPPAYGAAGHTLMVPAKLLAAVGGRGSTLGEPLLK